MSAVVLAAYNGLLDLGRPIIIVSLKYLLAIHTNNTIKTLHAGKIDRAGHTG